MKRILCGLLRLCVAISLTTSAAMAAPQLLVPHAGPVAKAERPRPFKSEGQRMQLNLGELKELLPGDDVGLRLNGKDHVIVFDVLKDEGNGVVSWIGHHKRGGPSRLRTIITTGPGGSFGTISTPEGQFRLLPGEGFDWLVDMEAEQPHLPPIDLKDDTLVVPPLPKALSQSTDAAGPEFALPVAGVDSVAISKATPAAVFVDLMVVYTPGLAANLGAGLQTRLNFIVTSANTMFADSEVGIVLRLVHSTSVNYPDTGSNVDALNAITPVSGGGGGVFAGIETLRSQYGADMVMFLRNGSDFGGSGIAWTLNQPMATGFAPYMYSAATGCVRSCEWVLIHELGHNMGNMHDRATVAWEEGGVAVPPAGSYAYSFGYYYCTSGALSCNPNTPGGCSSRPECSTGPGGTNNFADVMAYFHSSTVRNLRFSNPELNCSGSLGIQMPCGVAAGQPTQANAALSMNNNRIALSSMRGAVSIDSRLSNLSTRMQVLTGNDVMIGGFVIGGSANKTVVVRARGPSLVPFGITNALANPALQLVRSSDQATLATNDNWGTAANAVAVTASGFAPGNALEAAILVSLPPGAYTAIVSGSGGGTGVGIVEVFEVDMPAVPLANISTRGQVLSGNDVMIGGFVIQGTGPKTVVVRARGPSLVPFGITNALSNPSLQLVRSSDQAILASNDNWGAALNAASISASGFAPSNANEAAILMTLDPGAYTAIVSGVGGATGVGIVEVFTLP